MRRLLLSFICITSLSAHAWAFDESPESGIHQLAVISCFAFGPVGTGERNSNGEKVFREMLKNDFAEAYFIELFHKGTAEGKCYALVALREISSEFFMKYADSFRKTAPLYVNVISGRSLGQARSSDVLAEIEAGRYARYFSGKRV